MDRNERRAIIHSGEFTKFSYGDGHPFNVQRYRLVFELMNEYGLLSLPGSSIVDAPLAGEKDLRAFHDPAYLERLQEFSDSSEPRADFRYGLGDHENPVFPGFYQWARRCAGGTLEAARLIADEGYSVVFNPAGGWHHAHCGKAAGFSYLNDAAVAIKLLLERGARVAYLDLDAHHGDGVQEAFYDTERVLTVSLHETGLHFFPGTGFEMETGTGAGAGYSVNVPLLEHTDDALYMKAFDEVAFPLIAAFDPDVVVTQLGADTFRTDPLSRLEITTHGYSYVLRKIRALRLPWLAVGGGGYDIVNVARAWTLAWGIMNGIDLPPRLPPRFVATLRELGLPHTMLLDAMYWAEPDDRNRALDAVEKSIRTVRKEVFPVIIGRYGETSGH